MGQPAARVGDMHTCPLATPGTPPVPHVGGPILPPGGLTVLIGGQPAANVGTMCTCVGPPDTIVKGSFGVMVAGRPAARLGDNTAHGGVIALGFPTVLIGDVSTAVVTSGMNDVLGVINADNGTVNCGNIIDGVVDFLNDGDLNTVTTDRDGSWDAINNRLGTNIDHNVTTSFDDVYQDLEDRGPGSMTLLSVNDGGHVVVAANVSGQVGIMEGQDWGPDNPAGFITDPDVAASRYDGGDVSASPIP